MQLLNSRIMQLEQRYWFSAAGNDEKPRTTVEAATLFKTPQTAINANEKLSLRCIFHNKELLNSKSLVTTW
jgi:hypothetical protein